MSDMLAPASEWLERVKAALEHLGLTYTELAPFPLGVGIAVRWSDTDYVVLTVSAIRGGQQHQLTVISGVLRDVVRDRLAVLEACNQVTYEAAYPFFVHDADNGWDIQVQSTFDMALLSEVLAYFKELLENIPAATRYARDKFASNYTLGGRPYRWNDDDLRNLFIRSLM